MNKMVRLLAIFLLTNIFMVLDTHIKKESLAYADEVDKRYSQFYKYDCEDQILYDSILEVFNNRGIKYILITKKGEQIRIESDWKDIEIEILNLDRPPYLLTQIKISISFPHHINLYGNEVDFNLAFDLRDCPGMECSGVNINDDKKDKKPWQYYPDINIYTKDIGDKYVNDLVKDIFRKISEKENMKSKDKNNDNI